MQVSMIYHYLSNPGSLLGLVTIVNKIMRIFAHFRAIVNCYVAETDGDSMQLGQGFAVKSVLVGDQSRKGVFPASLFLILVD